MERVSQLLGNRSCLNTEVARFPWSTGDFNNYSLVSHTSQKSMKVEAAGSFMVEMASVSSIAVSQSLKVKKTQKNIHA